ncbi:MAG: hypothetical protein ILA02_01325 [Clostridia bacterium]|nr:hypothetical protein [Clostridia bacterium]
MDEDRLKHSIAVARKMIEIGREYSLNENELQDLFVLGFNHDIGYEFVDNLKHAHIGGDILKRNNYKYWKEVYYHGYVISDYTSIFLEILNKADMQIDKYGNDVGYDKRLEDIKNRYGEESIIYNDVKILIRQLKGDYDELNY